jgi:ethanolamine utilization protein EutJ
VGVDLGTAYLVLVVLDPDGQPLAGEYQFAQVVRDGLVVDYLGAIDRLVEMKKRVEARLGMELTHAASGYPPGVPQVEVRAMANVVEAAGLRCSTMVDEPSAANAVLQLEDGAIVDIGGGTTGIAILENGKVVNTADEATGGTHFSLVVAGAQDISFEAAEEMKVNPAEQERLFPIVRPVMEKVGDIVARHVRISQVEVKSLTLVGGTSTFPGMAGVVAVTIEKNHRIVKTRLFASGFGITFISSTNWFQRTEVRCQMTVDKNWKKKRSICHLFSVLCFLTFIVL